MNLNNIKTLRSINGTGLTFSGECDYESDGSYVSTCWISVSHLPILPIYSVRITNVSGDSGKLGNSHSFKPCFKKIAGHCILINHWRN
ncbi:Uncharacterised protein [Kingella negevensis]|uniref:Uncharacterized protein n=1 Tax=Kingella negevensis TaxID=1522312 RepID=A0A238HE93_9NEIS|nr:Uncharacterised protein [Kingella negevensis]